MALQRALIFSLAYYPDLIGGAEIAVKEITDRISPSDIEFHMVTLRTNPSQARKEKIGNIYVHRVGCAAQKGVLHTVNKYLFPFTASICAMGLHKKEKFHGTWSIMANYAGFAGLFFKLFNMNVPFILTLQEGDPISYILKRVRPVSRLFKMIFNHADRIQAISRYLADFGKDMGATCERVVIPNGVDVAHFTQDVSEDRIETMMRTLGKMPGDIFLITTSRLVTKNAVSDCISSLIHLPPQVKLLIVGTGELEQELKQQVRTLSLGDRVRFCGFVPHAELPLYLKVSDVFVRPSLSEGMGNSFIEAMATGTPVIATPVGGIVDFLTDKKTGLFCEVSAPEDIARKVEMYLRDINLRDEIVDNALHMVVDHYDWKLIAKDMKTKVFDILNA